MSTSLLRTGADILRFGASVRIECRDCGSVVEFGPTEFAERFGLGSLGIIAKHRQCNRCGTKRSQLLVLRDI
jgi:hypothetical protein